MRSNIAVLSFVCAVGLLGGCSNANLETTLSSSKDKKKDSVDEQKVLTRPLWEQNVKSSEKWTEMITKTIKEDAPRLLRGTGDVQEFCLNFQVLPENDKALFWAILISIISKHETNLQITYRKSVKDQIDPVTQRPLYKEGLLGLAYADLLDFPKCEFSYRDDTRFSDDDVRRSILIPKNQVQCGVFILSAQIQASNLIATPTNGHWESIRPGSANDRIEQIKSQMRKVEMCFGS